MKRKIAESILEALESRDFNKWYNSETGRFMDYQSGTYPEGDPRQPTKEQILADIERIFIK
jgi:hypothetical protein